MTINLTDGLKKHQLRLFLILVALMPGPLALGLYSSTLQDSPQWALALYANKRELSSLIAGFALSMLGFLAAVITILFAATNSEAFRRFKRASYLSTLFWIYYIAIISLVATAVFALFGFSNSEHVFAFRMMLCSFGNNLVQVAMLTVMITNLARRAGEEER